MCGRYFVEPNEELSWIYQVLGDSVKAGEIYPTNPAPVLVADGSKAEAMTWGFPNFRAKGVLINARAETAQEKKTFAESVMVRRCVIPTTGFFEWDKAKQKHLFTLPEAKALYIAGFWREYEGVRRFVILTTAPNETVAPIHNRMPLVLPKPTIPDWIQNTEKALNILHSTPPLLHKQTV